ncbi:hypothetical protein [Haliangium ochraceum]|uniref:Membrane protein involved in aromatic hydrocarbon degradation n=1 Tax=Haliangium ochraceum (strain DSM 14365 / JCM 11303 / SMP-2) TaxID=502025 RepID=D0LGW4_HALO1|nr:hypothetical protein [Haliangium ochraceum]ACY14686.1 hypothetical protein Hoch_2141 [Haliangium ochraceum DSM 14365]
MGLCAGLSLWLAPSPSDGIAPAAADSSDRSSARSIGRAGAGLVGEDGAAALLDNPGGLARREQWRAQVGVGVHQSPLRYRPGEDDSAAQLDDGAAASSAPLLGVQGSFASLLVGLAYLEPSELRRALPAAGDQLPAADIAALLPHRYGGVALDYSEAHLVLGAALRLNDWLALGASVGGARLHLRERRHVWAGARPRDEAFDPARDLVLTTAGSGYGLDVAVGALLAPASVPLELAASARITATGRLRGAVAAERAGDTAASQPSPTVALADAGASTSLPHLAVLRAGVRYLGERASVELDGDARVPVGGDATWQITGVELSDDSLGTVALSSVPRLFERGWQAALRASAEVELVPGFLWFHAGYAFRTGISRAATMVPVAADLDGHVLAAGVEVYGPNTTLTLGFAHTIASGQRPLTDGRRSTSVYDPAAAEPLGRGRYQGAHNALGVSLELAWE